MPTPMTPSIMSTPRLTSAMKRRRVTRGAAGSEIGADGEGERESGEEAARLQRRERGGPCVAGALLVPAVREPHRGDAIARAHTVQRGEPLRVGRLIVEDGASRTRVWVVPHVGLKGTDRGEDAHADAGRPAK